MKGKSSRRSIGGFLPKSITPVRKIYYMRMGFAALAGIFCGLAGFTGASGILAAIAFYIWSYAFAKYAFGRLFTTPEDRKKLYKTGIFSYILFWLAIWVLTYNFALTL
ncbi:MAG: hypothetical protein DRJ31_01285 [Candidatus Methanomethylicota archaeon]|uniref:Uncharacterized protein n=1 Tax=Thermoproteota archaeon TaxID=2056631 RepID=A0A497ETC5_9CREN|nr:MAG: hypothetical protein DRJ31_01285 [Candidatus Verstraetearchaeota archaeon]